MPARNWSKPENSTNDSVRTTRKKQIRSRSINETLDSWRIVFATWKSGVSTRSGFYNLSYHLHLHASGWILFFSQLFESLSSKIWFYRLNFINLQFYHKSLCKNTPVLGNIQPWFNLFSRHKKKKEVVNFFGLRLTVKYSYSPSWPLCVLTSLLNKIRCRGF